MINKQLLLGCLDLVLNNTFIHFLVFVLIQNLQELNGVLDTAIAQLVIEVVLQFSSDLLEEIVRSALHLLEDLSCDLLIEISSV